MLFSVNGLAERRRCDEHLAGVDEQPQDGARRQRGGHRQQDRVVALEALDQVAKNERGHQSAERSRRVHAAGDRAGVTPARPSLQADRVIGVSRKLAIVRPLRKNDSRHRRGFPFANRGGNPSLPTQLPQ